MRQRLLGLLLAIGLGVIEGCSQEAKGSDVDAPQPVDPAASGGQLVGCDTYDPGKVYGLGILLPYGGSNVASFDFETGNWCGLVSNELDDTFVTGASLRPDGSLVYAKARTVHRFVRDPDLYLDPAYGLWRLPSGMDVMENDLPVPGECPTLINGLVVGPDSGRIVLDCSQDRSPTVDGVTPSLTTAIFNLGFTAHTLASVRVGPPERRELFISDKNGDRTKIPDVVDPNRIVGTRARPDGFLVALSDPSVAGELLQVAFDGTAVKIGEYASLPGGLVPAGADRISGTAPHRVSAIDRDGVLFQIATRYAGSRPTYVVRRPLAPATATVVYGAAGEPVTLDGNGYRTLVTGP